MLVSVIKENAIEIFLY